MNDQHMHFCLLQRPPFVRLLPPSDDRQRCYAESGRIVWLSADEEQIVMCSISCVARGCTSYPRRTALVCSCRKCCTCTSNVLSASILYSKGITLFAEVSC